MKLRIAAVYVLLTSFAVAQKGTQPEERECDKQAQQYVTDLNKGFEGLKTYILHRAHYSPQTKTCYALLNAPYMSGKNFVVDWHLTDANEASDIGACRTGQGPAPEFKRFVFSCDFRRHSVKSEEDWLDLVSKEIGK